MKLTTEGVLVTVSANVFDVMLLSVAVMFALPAATAVARPLALMVAVAGLDELHVTCAVMLAVEPSLYMPVAVNCSVVLCASAMPGAVMAIDRNVGGGGGTVNAKLFDETELRLAVMLVLPMATPAAKPLALMVAVAEFDELHVTCAVMLAVEPSL